MAERPRLPTPPEDSQEGIPLVEESELEIRHPRYSLPPDDTTESATNPANPPELSLEDGESEPLRPSRGTPSTPLPRVWKAASEESDQGAPGLSDPAGTVHPHRFAPLADPDAAAPLNLEATPRLDTYETRRRVRLIIGFSLTALIALVVLIVYGRLHASGRGGAPGAPVDEAVLLREQQQKAAKLQQQKAAENAAARALAEREADAMLDRAREFEKKGRTD